MTIQPKVTRRKLADYKPAPDNPNQHNERGLQIIEDSINFNGAGRSGLAAADGTLLAGNGTWEAMARAGIEEVVEVEIDGKQWVVVKRNDLAPTDARAKALMVADNRASQVDYTPDHELLAALLGDIAAQDEQLVKAAGYNRYELAELLAPVNDEPPGDPGFHYQSQYAVIVTCDDEAHQEKVYNDLKAAGYECRVVVT